MKHFSLFSFLISATLFLNAQVDITFQVDMTGQTVSGDGVHVAGNFNGWSTTDNVLTDQGNGLFSTTLSLNPGDDVEFKYLNGNAWGVEETPPSDCSVGGNNRIFTVPASNDSLTVIPFGGCESTIEKVHVVFRVDMSDQAVDANGVHVAGNFNGWNPGSIQLSPIGDSIYEYKTDILASILVVQYKYVNGNDWGFEEAVPSECANGSSNRFADNAGDSVMLDTYKFGTCEVVDASTSIRDQFSPEVFSISPSPASDLVTVRLSAAGLNRVNISVIDLTGRVYHQEALTSISGIYEHGINVAQLAGGIYMMKVESDLGSTVKKFIVKN